MDSNPSVRKQAAARGRAVLASAAAMAMISEQAYTMARSEPRRGRLNVPPRRLKLGVGRNHPCPCGSGKRFKRCCLDRAEGR